MIITSEDIKNSIISRLLELFPDASIYKEAKTNPSYPHFFVYQLNLSVDKERKNHHIYDYLLDIRYRISSDPSTNLKLQQNLDSVSFILLNNMNIIKCKDSYIRCEEKSIEKVDEILHFFCHFKILVKLENENENENIQKFNNLEVNLNVR